MNLREIRTKKGMTQAQIAERIGVTSQAVCNYEVGIREPNIETLKSLASVLECTVDELIGDDDDEGRTGQETA